ncbi:MAG: hypothetical protein K9J17_02585 [Flavobacteriales bacterium]|nr:hypothetical protein [Flavobacteriales bacterium]
MKTQHVILAILGSCAFVAMLAIAGSFIFSYHGEVPTHRRTYLLDRTNEFQLSADSEHVELEFSMDELKQSRRVVIRPVTDILTEDRIHLELPAYRIIGEWSTTEWEGHKDEEYRRGQIEKFELGVSSTISEVMSERIGYDRTSFIRSLVQELQSLSDYPTDDRALIVFSDLAEFNDERNWLDASPSLERMKKDDRLVWDEIPGAKELELKGIHIFFIYRPTQNQETSYRTRSEFLKRRLEEQGARVVIRAKDTHLKF